MKHQFVTVDNHYIPYSSILYVSVVPGPLKGLKLLPGHMLNITLLDGEATWRLPEEFSTKEAAQAAAVALTERIHAARTGRNFNDLRH